MLPIIVRCMRRHDGAKSYLVYRLRVAQHRGDPTTASRDVECLIEWHDRAKHLGRHDDDMQVLWTAFWRVGKRAEASSLLRDYLLNARRERRPISSMLLSRTKEDPIWRAIANDASFSAAPYQSR